MQETWAPFLIQADPTFPGVTRPVQPESLELQLLNGKGQAPAGPDARESPAAFTQMRTVTSIGEDVGIPLASLLACVLQASSQGSVLCLEVLCVSGAEGSCFLSANSAE